MRSKRENKRVRTIPRANTSHTDVATPAKSRQPSRRILPNNSIGDTRPSLRDKAVRRPEAATRRMCSLTEIFREIPITSCLRHHCSVSHARIQPPQAPVRPPPPTTPANKSWSPHTAPPLIHIDHTWSACGATTRTWDGACGEHPLHRYIRPQVGRKTKQRRRATQPPSPREARRKVPQATCEV